MTTSGNLRTPDSCLLITGGSGELGQQLVAAAGHANVHATFLTHSPPVPNVRWHRLDINDREAVHRLAKFLNPDLIVHTAVSDRSRPPGSTPDDLRHSIVEGGLHVAEAAAATQSRCIALSTDLVFDGKKGYYSEDDPARPLMPYGQDKLDMESAMLEAGANLVIVRSSLILTLEPMGRHAAWIVEALTGGQARTLFTDELRCPIWSDELAAALLELGKLDFQGLLHLAGPEQTHRYDLGLRMARHYGLDSSRISPGLSCESGLNRPLNCTLDSSRAYDLLKTPIHGLSARLPKGRTGALPA